MRTIFGLAGKKNSLPIILALAIIIIVEFIYHTYLIETTTQGALQYIIPPTDPVKPLQTQHTGKHTRRAAIWATY